MNGDFFTVNTLYHSLEYAILEFQLSGGEMNRSISKKGLVAAGAVFLALNASITGCSKSSGEDLVEPKQIVKAQDVSVSLLIADSKTGGAPKAPVTVLLKGAAAPSVITLDEKKGTEFSDESGSFSFFVPEGAGKELVIVSVADGYINGGKTVVLQSGKNLIDLEMINIAEPPKSVALATKKLEVGTDGAVKAETSLQTTAASDASAARKTESVKVVLPEGTVLKDADGKVVSGNVKLVATYHNNEEIESLETFPGGFNVTAEVTGGAQDEGSFISGGFTSIEIQNDAGQDVKTFSKPIDVTISIAKGTINPKTGKTVAAGDIIPTWSYDKDLGKWTQEADAKVSTDSKGNLIGTLQVSHLSYWNLDWWQSENCGNSFTAGSKAPFIALGENARGKNVRFMFNRVGGGWSHSALSTGDDTLFFDNYPKDIPVSLTAYFDGQVVGKKENFKAACGENIDINLDLPAAESFATVSVSTVSVCSNIDDATIKEPIPSVPMFIVDVNGYELYINNRSSANPPIYFFRGASNAEGVETAYLTEGRTYYVMAQDRFGSGAWRYQKITLTQNTDVEIAFPTECQITTGGVAN